MKNKNNVIHIFDWNEMAEAARKTVAEGCVLLKNDKKALPIKKGEKTALFGRSMFNYYKSGTGSGGSVNVPYVRGILDAFEDADKEGEIILDRGILDIYREWLKGNPFEMGEGWAAEPWNQKEMALDEKLVEDAAKRNDIAVYVIGRTAGEDKDNRVAAGSYLLTKTEEDVLGLLTSKFDRVAVLLNVGNIMDMKWVKKYDPSAVMYVWQGGMQGGDGVADVVLGRENPSGRLSDTIAEYMEDYPSSSNFGSDTRNLYEEDIYIGYRYFETFAPGKVIYPFGFGLSYTDFDITCDGVIADADRILFNISVRNTGDCPGAQTVQLYVSKPQGSIGNPARELVGFNKTDILSPAESCSLSIDVPMDALASYDDSGSTGFVYSYVAQAGEYAFYLGENVRAAKPVYSMTLAENVCVKNTGSALAPVCPFRRIKPLAADCGYIVEYEDVPLKNYDINERVLKNRPVKKAYTGDRGIRLADVMENRASLDEFMSQLSDEELICMSRGEGMCSPKVTAGTAAAFGGVTEALKGYGIPAGCCADGPSGIRMDCGTNAFSMPNGTLLACTFNTELVERLYELEGKDLRRNKIDLLLGPGINMHRNPLNGRNFEYFSEDPFLTGAMAVAELKGMNSMGVSGTIKHFAGNEQEWNRYEVDSVVSERALREIYLKPFEMAVKEGNAISVMTTYGSLNGQYTAGNYDLCTTILRNEWGFDGIVMTDWWAKVSNPGEEGSMDNTVPMIMAQNDIYMVVSDSLSNSAGDNSETGLKEGKITRGELVRNASNICRVLMKSPCMKREAYGVEDKWEQTGLPEGAVEKIDWTASVTVDREAELVPEDMPTDKGTTSQIDVALKRKGKYVIEFQMSSKAGELAQMPMSVFNGTGLLGTISITGTGGKVITRQVEVLAEVILSLNLKLKFGLGGIKIHKISIKWIEPEGETSAKYV